MTNHEFAALLLAQPEMPLYILATDPTDWTSQIPVEADQLNIDDEFIPDEEDPLYKSAPEYNPELTDEENEQIENDYNDGMIRVLTISIDC